MVEQNEGLVMPEKKQLTNEDIIEFFGANYRQLIEDKAVGLGINAKLNFFDSPLPHEGSQAVYLVEQLVEDHLILVPVLGPNMRTSRHHHESPMVQEIYFYIVGESFIKVGKEEHLLNRERPRIDVPLDAVHQVRTEEKPALTLIIMEKARLVPPDRLHIKDV